MRPNGVMLIKGDVLFLLIFILEEIPQFGLFSASVHQELFENSPRSQNNALLLDVYVKLGF
jgi:hypothetical protein